MCAPRVGGWGWPLSTSRVAIGSSTGLGYVWRRHASSVTTVTPQREKELLIEFWIRIWFACTVLNAEARSLSLKARARARRRRGVCRPLAGGSKYDCRQAVKRCLHAPSNI